MQLRKSRTLGADAHQPNRVADGYEAAMELLKTCGFSHVNYFTNRKRQEFAIDDALASLVSDSVA